MGAVGNLGDIQFEIEESGDGVRMLSFSDFTRSGAANFAEHERNGKKALLEFSSPGLETVTLKIRADARYQTKPWEVQTKLQKYRKKGKRLPLIVGGHRIGCGYFAITNISEAYERLYADGSPVIITFDVTLQEYPKKGKTDTASQKSVSKKASATATKKTTSKKTAKTSKATTYSSYTVQTGDTLSAIAKKYYGKASAYPKIYNANKDIIKNPDKIYTGQVLKIPK